MTHAIGTALLLLSLTGGAFLLAKVKKEALGIFYQVIAWFVISASLLMLFVTLIMGICGGCHKHRIESFDQMRCPEMQGPEGMCRHEMHGPGNMHGPDGTCGPEPREGDHEMRREELHEGHRNHEEWNNASGYAKKDSVTKK